MICVSLLLISAWLGFYKILNFNHGNLIIWIIAEWAKERVDALGLDSFTSSQIEVLFLIRGLLRCSRRGGMQWGLPSLRAVCLHLVQMLPQLQQQVQLQFCKHWCWQIPGQASPGKDLAWVLVRPNTMTKYCNSINHTHIIFRSVKVATEAWIALENE